MEDKLNDLTIKWSIVMVDGYITKKIQEEVSRNRVIGGSPAIADNAIYTHSANDDFAKKRNEEFIKILKRNNRSGRVITITDKQFGMSLNNYNGVAQIDKETPISNYLIINRDSNVMTIPVTSEQIKNTIKF